MADALTEKHDSTFAKLCRLMASGFGVGFIRYAPGTFGSLLGLALTWGYWHWTRYWSDSLRQWLAGVFVIALIWLAHRIIVIAERVSREHDPKWIVIDEVAGQALVVIWFAPTFWTYLIGFALFRVFDILKPGPIGRMDQKLESPWGTLVDDLLAGAVAAAALFALKSLTHLP